MEWEYVISSLWFMVILLLWLLGHPMFADLPPYRFLPPVFLQDELLTFVGDTQLHRLNESYFGYFLLHAMAGSLF